jgi:hypothetical protein
MTIPREERPTAGRVVLGFLAAAFAEVSAVVFLIASAAEDGMMLESVLGLSVFAFLFGVPFALLANLIIALPVYLVLSRHWHVRWWNAALTGFAIVMAPSVLVGAGLGGEPLQLGLAGLVGGLAFWAIVRERPAHPRIDAETFR